MSQHFPHTYKTKKLTEAIEKNFKISQYASILKDFLGRML